MRPPRKSRPNSLPSKGLRPPNSRKPQLIKAKGEEKVLFNFATTTVPLHSNHSSDMLAAMNETTPLPRSPELMSRGDTALLVIDVQEKLLPAIPSGSRVVWNVRRLIDAAKALGVPVASTEQYPKGLGPTTPELAERLGAMPSKLTFSSCGCPEVFERLRARGIHKVLICGIETHVCVAQTALDLMADGWRVYVAVDAVGSRFEIDYRTALGRMDSAGATLTTTEAAMFEWCQTADTPEFKEISRLAREPGP
jgi:nicotinamidase-related amidase